MDAPRVRVLPRELLGAARQVVGGVERLDRNARDGGGLQPVLAPGLAGLELLLPDLLWILGPDLHSEFIMWLRRISSATS